jgi:dUTP pyrophosphatase
MTVMRYIVLPHGEGLPAPAYRSQQAAGLDLSAALSASDPLTLGPGERALIPTGISLEIPEGFEAQVRPRSGLAHKHGVTVLNSPGTIDADYRGEIKVLLTNLGNESVIIRRGDRIAQLVVSPVLMVTLKRAESLATTGRGKGGFGSTGSS